MSGSRLAETSHQVEFTRSEGFVVNERNGNNISLYLYRSLYLQIVGENKQHDKNTVQKIEELDTLSESRLAKP